MCKAQLVTQLANHAGRHMVYLVSSPDSTDIANWCGTRADLHIQSCMLTASSRVFHSGQQIVGAFVIAHQRGSFISSRTLLSRLRYRMQTDILLLGKGLIQWSSLPHMQLVFDHLAGMQRYA